MMWSQALRRPLGARLHRTVRFARRYNGQNPIPHTTYFQPPPQPSRPPGRILRSALLAISSFGLGIFTATWLIDYAEDAIEDDEASEIAENFGVSGDELGLAMEAYMQSRSAGAVPFVDLKYAQLVLERQRGFSVGIGCVGHHCSLPSNLPCEDTSISGGYTFFDDSAKNWSFYCIFDGHAGPRTANVLPDLLPGMLGTKLYTQGCMSRQYVPNDYVIVRTIKEAFRSVDEGMLEQAKMTVNSSGADMSFKFMNCAPVLSGSCALVALFDRSNSVLRVANTGDSRAVLGRWDSEAGKYVAKAMSIDQTGFNPDEVKRLRSEHPGEDVVDPKTGRVHGIAVSRAFGDARVRYPRDRIALENLRHLLIIPKL
jgi:pyruvate dehydrogenase phosphatase